MKVDYVKLVLLQFMRSREFDELWGGSWIPDENYRDFVRRSIREAFDNQSILLGPQVYDELFDELFEELVKGKAVAYDGDDYSDRWIKINFSHKNKLVEQSIASNPAHQRIARLGSEAFRRALRKIAKEDGHLFLESEGDQPDADIAQQEGQEVQQAPASDRIVTFDHNSPEACEVLELTEEASEAIRGSNSIEEEERSWIREHISAGVEFIRRHKKILTGAIEALLLKPLRAAYEAIAEEPAKAAIMAAIKAIKTMFGL